MYRLKWSAYNGLSYTATEGDERDVRRSAAIALHNARRDGQPVTIIERGREWEFLTPDDAATIGDRDGLLYIRHETFECRECGSKCETRNDASLCCMYSEDDDDFDQRVEDEHIYNQELSRQLIQRF